MARLLAPTEVTNTTAARRRGERTNPTPQFGPQVVVYASTNPPRRSLTGFVRISQHHAMFLDC
jgi:hypothetical protein